MKTRGKSRRRRQQQQLERPELGIAGFLLAAFLLALVAYFLRDAKQLQYGLLGSYVWVIALAASFFAFLAYYSQFILPMGGEKGWYEGLRLLGAYFINAPFKKMRPSSLGASTSPTAISPSFSSIKAGMVESHYTLALARYAIFTRAAGPGYVSLNRKEIIAYIVDLRPHLRSQRAKAMTRDGIPLETSITVIFRIKQLPRDQAPPNDPYPYDPDAIFRAGYSGAIRNGEDQQHWSDRICPHAAGIVVTILSRFTLDELMPPDHADREPAIYTARSALQKEVTTFFDPLGIEVLLATIGQLDLPADIVEQRIHNWQADWQRRIHVQQASANAEALKRVKDARALAQIAMINNITTSLQGLRQTSRTDLAEVITLRMLDALEEAATDETVQLLTPQHVMTNLAQIRHWLQQPENPRLSS